MPTPALRDLQRGFWEALATTPGSNSAADSFTAMVEPSATMDAAGRVQVYVDAYYWRIHQVLRETFPRVAERVPAEQLQQLFGDYLRDHPSRHPSIGYIGVGFPSFLRKTDIPPYLADLAQLEWTKAIVFESPDALTLSASILREIAPEDWPGLTFHPIPGLQTLDLEYPVHLLWRNEAAAIDVAQPTRLRVWRAADFKVMDSVLDEREAAALESMIDGRDFATICEAFADLPEEQAAQESIALLLRWLADGILSQNCGDVTPTRRHAENT